MTLQIHSLTNPSAPSVLNRTLHHLTPHLPTSLPLYRRLQSGRFLPSSHLFTSSNLNQDNDDDENTPWLIAFVDRSCRPETEIWMYGSWESSSSAAPSDTSTWATIERIMASLLHEVKNLPVEPSIHQDVLDSSSFDSEIVLFGAVHERSLPVLENLGVLVSSVVPNSTFVFDVDHLPPARPLPEKLRWGEVGREYFNLVRSRTEIKRQDRTLAVSPSLAIYPATIAGEATAPIAWAFVGLDGSLTTLHVEAEWRGRGLAKALTTRLFREKMGAYFEREEKGTVRWAHGYVVEGNERSEGMCRSLGGRSHWLCYWLRVDLGKV